MRLLVKVLPLPGASGAAGSGGAKQFNLLVKPGSSFGDIWPLIETRFKNAYPLEARDFIIKKLQDIYGCDIALEDVVDLFFEDEPDQQKRMIHVVQAPLDRDISVALGSGLRPPNALKRALPPAVVEANKRRRVERDLYGCAVEDMQPDRPVRSNESDSDLVVVEDSQRETAPHSEDRLNTVAKSESPGGDERSLMDVPTDGGFRLPGLPASSLRDRRVDPQSQESAPELPNGQLSPIAESPSVSELGVERTRPPSSPLSSTPPSAQRPRGSLQREHPRHSTHSLDPDPSETPMTSQRRLRMLKDRIHDKGDTPPAAQGRPDSATPSRSMNAPTSSGTQSGAEEIRATALAKLKDLAGDKPFRDTSGSWTAKEDDILLTARAAGLSYEEIGNKWLPSRGREGVRKRYARIKYLQDSTAPSPTTEGSTRKRKMSLEAAAELERLNEKHRAKEAEKAAAKKKQEACIQRQIKAKKYKDAEKRIGKECRQEEAQEAQEKRDELKLRKKELAGLRRTREALEKSLSAPPRSSQESAPTTSQDQTAKVPRQSKLPFPRQKANNLKTYGRSPTKHKVAEDPFAVPSDNEDEPAGPASNLRPRNAAAANEGPTEHRSTRSSKATKDGTPVQAAPPAPAASQSSLPDKNVPLRRSVSFNEELDISNRYAQPREPNHGTESPRSSILKSAKKSREALPPTSGLRVEGLRGDSSQSQKLPPTEHPVRPSASWSFDKLDLDEAAEQPDERHPDPVEPTNEDRAEFPGSSPVPYERGGPTLPSEELGEKLDDSPADSQKTAARYVSSSSPSSHSGSEAASAGGSPPASSPPAISTTARERAQVSGSPSGSDIESEESDNDGSSPSPLPPSPSPAPITRKPLRSAMKGSRSASRSATSNTPTTTTSNSTSDKAASASASKRLPASVPPQAATPRAMSRTPVPATRASNTPKPVTTMAPRPPSTTPRPLSRVTSGASTPRAANRSGLHSLSYLKSLPPAEIPKPVYTGPMPKAKGTAADEESSSDSDSDSSSSSDSDDDEAKKKERKPKKSRWSGLVDLANANSFPM